MAFFAMFSERAYCTTQVDMLRWAHFMHDIYPLSKIFASMESNIITESSISYNFIKSYTPRPLAASCRPMLTSFHSRAFAATINLNFLPLLPLLHGVWYRQRTHPWAIGQTVGNFFTLLFGQPHSAIRAALQSSQGKVPTNASKCRGQPFPIF